jgi:hypothetical protein
MWSSVEMLHGSSTSHSRYVRVTVYSALDGCMPFRRSSCFLAAFSASSGILALRIFSPNSSRSPPPSSSSPSSSLIALSCWRSTYSRWLRPISSCTWVLMRSRTFNTSSWRDRNWSTLRVRVLMSKVSRTSCFSPTSSSRLAVIRSARWPGSVTESTSAPASLGTASISLTTRLAMSFRFITSASSSTSDVVGSGTARTLAARNGSAPSKPVTSKRLTPWRITEKLSLASLMTLRMRAAQPTRYRSPEFGSSVRASFWVRMPMTGRSLAIASSTNRTDLRRPTSIGMIEPGNRTELRRGRIGRTSGISTGWS